MHPKQLIKKSLATILTLSAMLTPGMIGAATYTQDTFLTVAGVQLKILAGSQYDSLTTQTDGFTVAVAANEAFIVRSPGTSPTALENDGGYPACQVTTNRDNQLIINGPKTVTVRPTTSNCSTTGYQTKNTPFLTLGSPNGGESLTAGQDYQLFWSTAGTGAGSVRLRLSTDGGATYSTTIATDIMNNGFYQWTVPSMTTTSQARIKIEGFNNQLIVAMDLSDANFTINGTTPPPPPPPPPGSQPTAYDYDPAAETFAATTIDDDRGYVAPASPIETCVSGTRIKNLTSPAVYYCGRDGKRHAFPNQKIYNTWFNGFTGVVVMSDADLAKVPLGENVTYRPGVKMIKLQTDPKVYAVAKDGTLRWVPDEWTVKALYGDDWNTKIDDLSDAFFVDYQVGDMVRPK